MFGWLNFHSPGWREEPSAGCGREVLGTDWALVEASELGEDTEPMGLLGELVDTLISAVLVVAVMGRWGIRNVTGAACSRGLSVGGEIFPFSNTECSVEKDSYQGKLSQYQILRSCTPEAKRKYFYNVALYYIIGIHEILIININKSVFTLISGTNINWYQR